MQKHKVISLGHAMLTSVQLAVLWSKTQWNKRYQSTQLSPALIPLLKVLLMNDYRIWEHVQQGGWSWTSVLITVMAEIVFLKPSHQNNHCKSKIALIINPIINSNRQRILAHKHFIFLNSFIEVNLHIVRCIPLKCTIQRFL